MKPLLLALALPVLALTGCATGGYYGDYGSGYYGPGYAYGPDYYDGPDVGFAFYDGGHYGGRGYYHGGFAHDYHHYDSGHRGFATAARSSSFHGTSHVASARGFSHSSGGGRSVSSGAVHLSGGGHSGGSSHHR